MKKRIISVFAAATAAVFLAACGGSSAGEPADTEDAVNNVSADAETTADSTSADTETTADYESADADQDTSADGFDPELDEITLELDGISGEYSLLFLADNQANFDSREDLGWFGTKESRAFRDADGVASEDNLPGWIDYANAGEPDAVIFGGDILDIYTENNAARMYELLSCLEMPYLYTYGNHDSYVPWENCFEDDAEAFLRLFPDGNCEFSCLDMDDFYIVSVRDYAQDGTANVSAEALEAFRGVYNEGKPIILSIHVPVAADGLTDLAEEYWGGPSKLYDAGDGITVFESILLGEDCGYDMTPETQEFLELLLAEDSPVKLILAGHLHMAWSGQLENGTPQYVAAGAYENAGTVLTVVPAK
ncbi:MAG: metallophosphoesterase [Lachnospiraceae bacterium]|nr:metallophosphoesterase [Lachnospiraceae bacterium]